MGPWPVIVLAAGTSRRFGSDKRFACLADGRYMLERTLDECRRLSALRYLVVDSEQANVLALAQSYDFRSVVAGQAVQGMGSSLAAGVAALPSSVTACWICPADLPALSVAALQPLVQRLLASEAGYEPVVTALAPSFQGRRGHPAWIARSHFDYLLSLSSDQGAKALWQPGAGGQVQAVDHSGVVLDADTPEQLYNIQLGSAD